MLRRSSAPGAEIHTESSFVKVVSEMVCGDSEPVQKTLYYYRVLSHDYKDLLEWDDNKKL